MPYNEAAFLAGLERGMRGKGWRQERFPGPLDLLMKLDKTYIETQALRLLSDELVAATERRETTVNAKYLALSAPPQEGKALALDTPIATPDGWTTMGELKVGDQVFDRRGKPCNVIAVSRVWTDRPCYTVRTGDGEAITADAAHEWVAVTNTKARDGRRERIVETTVLAAKWSKNAQIDGPGDLELPSAVLPLDPYVLGVWLGDGHTNAVMITVPDWDMAIVDRVRAAGFPVRKATGPYAWSLSDSGPGVKSTFRKALETAGVFGNKHIPIAYQRGSRAQRLALLQGLVDTDGYVDPRGQVEFCSTDKGLAEGVVHLVFSLGAKATIHEGRALLYGKDCGPKYRVRFYMKDAAYLPRKAERCKDSSVGRRRYVWAEFAETVPTMCIEVDSYDHTFLAGRTLLPTHNSSLVARAFPLWLLMRDPDLRILVISYDDGSSVRWGRALKNALKAHSGPTPHNGMDVGLSLKPGSEAVNQLELDGYIGGLSCMSLIGGITGKPADVIILDDVVRDRRTARSAAFKTLWREQWQTAITSRLSAKSLVVMDHTRWLADDPIGQQLAEHGSRWRYVNIPAIVEARPAAPGEAPAPVNDPLGREEGEWLNSARKRSPQEWEQKRKDVGEPDFWALYQGSPFPATGALFSLNDFRWWEPTGDPWVVRITGRPGPDENLHYSTRFITVDLAASKKTSADFTVAAAWAIAGTGELLLLDLKRVQVEPASHWDEAVAPLHRFWNCPIYIEGSQYGTDLVYTATREGAVVHALEADTDKYTRAIPAARRMKQGGIYFPKVAHWLPEFRTELKEFPTGAHDDQVDVLSYAHRVRGAIWVAPDNSRGGHGQYWSPPAPNPMDHLAGGPDLYSAPL